MDKLTKTLSEAMEFARGTLRPVHVCRVTRHGETFYTFAEWATLECRPRVAEFRQDFSTQTIEATTWVTARPKERVAVESFIDKFNLWPK